VEKAAPRGSGKTITLDDGTYCPIDTEDIIGRKFNSVVPGKTIDPKKK